MEGLPRRSAQRAVRRFAPIVAALLVVAACSSGDGTESGPVDTTTPPASEPETTRPTAVPTPDTSPDPTKPVPNTTVALTTAPPAATDPADETALEPDDVEAITASFLTFFGGQESTTDDKVEVLEDGETYRSMLEEAGANEQFQQMSTDIREIRAGSDVECVALEAYAGCAVVLHDLLVGGFPMAAAIESPAVEIDGSWLVGARAWCNVVEIGGASCPTGSGQNGSSP